MRDVDLGFGPDFKLSFSPKDHQGFAKMRFVQVRGGKPVHFTDWKSVLPKP